tara:strand:+ start:20 stop:385 length:366 start_codon:yes stop_codon:yes gene_type:complete
MSYKPFKMKGSPIKRNFGVGRRELDRGGSLFKFTYKDLEKKFGLGPREISEDDQSKEAARVRYEMGVYKVDPTKPPVITDMEDPEQRKLLYNKTEVMRDGLKNRTHGAGNTGNWQAHQFRD